MTQKKQIYLTKLSSKRTTDTIEHEQTERECDFMQMQNIPETLDGTTKNALETSKHKLKEWEANE